MDQTTYTSNEHHHDNRQLINLKCKWYVDVDQFYPLKQIDGQSWTILID